MDESENFITQFIKAKFEEKKKSGENLEVLLSRVCGSDFVFLFLFICIVMHLGEHGRPIMSP